MVSAAELPKRYVDVLGRRMAYAEVGTGDPIVFLHGNPTSSYLWRNVLPPLAGLGRCVAPDLLGMGDSQKLPRSGPGAYSFDVHRRHLDAFLEAVGAATRPVLVAHDWGTALGFDWARRHPDAVRGLAYMEGIVRPLSWTEWPPASRPLFQALRSPAGEEMILERNLFVERILPGSVIRTLSEAEMEVYRRPYREPGEGRRPTLDWPRQIPLEGEPPAVCSVVEAYARWLASSPVPKLFVNAEPGAILTGAPREFCRTWPNQREVTVTGIHFIQEDSAPDIAAALVEWISGL